jgi:hypothetical protein
MTPVAVFVPQQMQRANTQYKQAEKICGWLKENFTRVAQEGQEVVYQTDLQRLLQNNNTTDSERRIIGGLMAWFDAIGKVVHSYPAYTVSVDLQVSEYAYSAQVHGIGAADLDSYLEGLQKNPAVGGWLPASEPKPIVDQVKEYLMPF